MRLSLVLRAVASSWLAVLVNAIVGFLLTPYVLHHLGDVEFGLYTLVTTMMGYYGIFDLGVRSSILRFVSRALALKDHDEINRVVCSAFYCYSAICLLAILSTFLLAPWIPRMFGVSGPTADSFRSLFLLAGILAGIQFPLNAYTGSLSASGRYDQVYTVQILGLALRAAALILVIRRGGHLFAVGAVVLLSILLTNLAQIPLALRAIGWVSLHPKWVSKASLREMFRYASVTLGVGIGDRLKANIFPVLVGIVMNPVAVTLFSLPTKLLRFPVDGIATMMEVVNPASSYLEAREDYVKLRHLMLFSVQGAFLLLAPLAAVLFIFGRDILRLWVGPAYLSAYPLLVLLTLGMGLGATQDCVQSMLFGIGRHKGLIGFRLGEAASFVLVGTIALKFSGLTAFALVVSATLMITSLVLLPRHMCKILSLPLSTYLTEGCLKPSLMAIPFVATLFALRSLFALKSWIDLMGVLIVASFVYLAALVWITFRPKKASGSQWSSLGILELLAKRARPVLAKARVFA
jgi:O-antigen/teichoic acid export membrane protein